MGWSSFKKRPKIPEITLPSKFRCLVDNSPLSLRGWVLQECLLSSKILHCAQGVLFWEDDTGYYSENGSSMDSVGIRADWKKQKLLYDWYQMMEIYSKCDLTHEKDRLPAIAGLAASFQSDVESSYCAGIWGKQLHQGLLWMLLEPVYRAWPVPSTEEIKPPTWSWAHYAQPVQFLRLPNLTCLVQLLGFVPTRKSSVSVARGNLSGQAYLSVRARLLWMEGIQFGVPSKSHHIFKNNGNANAHSLQRVVIKETRQTQTIGFVNFDTLNEPPEPSKIWFLQIALTIPKYNRLTGCPECKRDSEHADYHTEVWAVPNIYILVIMKEDGRDYYQRLGLGRIEEHLWPPDCGVVDILMR